MKAHLASSDPLVIDGLQYKLKPNGEYVTKRESVTFYPSGSNIYQAVGGTKVLRIVLADSASTWLDGESVKVMMHMLVLLVIVNKLFVLHYCQDCLIQAVKCRPCHT